MNAIGRRLTIQIDIPADAHSDARTELARHSLDLRVHALVMLAGAILAGYCGIRLMDIGDAASFGEPMKVAMPPDLLSICAFIVFFAIAALCLLEAHRGWKKAAIEGARNGSDNSAARQGAQPSPSGF